MMIMQNETKEATKKLF